MDAAKSNNRHPLIEAGRRTLAGGDPLDALRWAAGTFPGRAVLTTGFGREGSVLLDLVARHHLSVDIATLDTGLLFEETYVFWRRLETHYGISIRAVRPRQTVDEQAQARGPELWARAPATCCRLRKVLPLADLLGSYDAWITGIRREQTPERAQAERLEVDRRFEVVKVNPLLDWSGAQVTAFIESHGVPTHPLHARGYPSIGCRPCTTPVLPEEDARAGRWRGTGRTECGLHSRTPALGGTPSVQPQERQRP